MIFNFLMDFIGATKSENWIAVVSFMPLAFLLTAFVASAISFVPGFFCKFCYKTI